MSIAERTICLRCQEIEAHNDHMKTTRAGQTAATRKALLSAGRKLFAERGYYDTFTNEIVETAGLTRGALYHHFRRKEDLFRAVYEDVELELMQKITGSVFSTTDPRASAWERLRRGIHAFLDHSLDPSVQRITLLDAPAVLGWEAWREIDAKYGYGLLRAAIQAAIDEGSIDEQPTEPLASFLFGGLIEAAMLIARAADVEVARDESGQAVDRLLGGIKSATP